MDSTIFWGILVVVAIIAICLTHSYKKRSEMYEKCEAKRFNIGNRINNLKSKPLTQASKRRLETLQERLNRTSNYTRTTVEDNDFHMLKDIEFDLATTESFASVGATRFSPALKSNVDDWHTSTQVKHTSSYDHDYSSSWSSGSSYSDSSSCSSSDSGSSGGCGGGD